ncbi:MAG: hypothetical protein JW982_10515 [Spirochaetes bacterium]|nr:hypothetical protein [Spirochaetota bacterium]
MKKYEKINEIPIGGLVAIGFDSNEKYLLLITHSGRGLFEIKTMNKIARDYEVMYPNNSEIKGIGILQEEIIKVYEFEFNNKLEIYTKSNKYKFVAESDSIECFKVLL